MGIELYWDNADQTVFLIEVKGDWTWDQMLKMVDTIKGVTDNTERVIAAILDLSDGLRFPGGSIFTPTALEHAKRMLEIGKDGTGPVVVVGTNTLIRTIYNTFRTWDKNALKNVNFTDTVDQARALLRERQFNYQEAS